MIKWIVSALLSPLTKLGEKYLSNQADREKLEHGTDRIAIEADASVRKVLLSHPLLRIPVFVVQISAASYFASVMFDSTFPTDYLNPLKLPESSEIVYQMVMASMVGLGVWKTVSRGRQ